MSERTIRSWIEQVEKGGRYHVSKDGRGKKKRFSEDDMIAIWEDVKENPYQALSRQLALKYEVSQPCMLSTLHELDFEYRSTKVFPGLSPEDIRLRVEFAREQDKIPSQLNRV